VEGGCERNKFPIPLGRGAFNVALLPMDRVTLLRAHPPSTNCTILDTLNAPLTKGIVTLLRSQPPSTNCTILEILNAPLPKGIGTLLRS
jgi:hypothetical protein